MTTNVIVTPPASVDIKANDVGVVTPAPAGEESMSEYGARREAEIRGVKYEPKAKEEPAAAIEQDPPAAATETKEVTAAATEEIEDEGKTTPAPATEEDPEAQIEEAHPAKKGIQKRFSEMTAKQKELQTQADQHKREAEEARAEVERMKAEAAKAAETIIPVVAKAEDDPAPDREAFDDPDEYFAALTAHAARSEIRKATEAAVEAKAAREAEVKKAEQEANNARVQAQIVDLHKAFNERVEKAAEDYPDYAEKVTNNESFVLRNDVFFAIEKAELAPHILYHIASNPDVAKELNELDPFAAAMRIGEMQAEIRVARKPTPTKAAAPVTPIGSRTSPARKTPDEESMTEYAARVEKEMQDKAKRTRTRLN